MWSIAIPSLSSGGRAWYAQNTVQKHQVKEEFSGHGQRQKHKTIRKMSAVEKSLGVPTPQERQRSHTWDKTTEIISFILFRSKQVQPGEWGAGGIRLHLSRRVSKNVGLS